MPSWAAPAGRRNCGREAADHGVGSPDGHAKNNTDGDSSNLFSPMGSRRLADLVKEDWEEPLALRLGLTPSQPWSRAAPLSSVAAAAIAAAPALQHGLSVPGVDSLFSGRLPSASSAFVLQPGQFEVVLAVDTREKGRKNDKGIIQQKLTAMGVEVVVRPLPLGDFLWIAREKALPVPGQLCLPTRSELVLEYVVERKRMDDLVRGHASFDLKKVEWHKSWDTT